MSIAGKQMLAAPVLEESVLLLSWGGERQQGLVWARQGFADLFWSLLICIEKLFRKEKDVFLNR